MNKRKKALLLASAASLCILCGCGKKTETVEIDGEIYVVVADEYTKIDIPDKTFEPGTHIIHYVDIPDPKPPTFKKGGHHLHQGFDNAMLYTGEVPEGYKLVGVTSYAHDDDYSFDYYIVYIFVNEKTVVAKGSYDAKNNEVVYETPGEVVEDVALGLEP